MGYLLYTGRFQPFHEGHAQLMKSAIIKYPNLKPLVSIDIRNKDKSNPYSFEYRQMMVKQFLSEVEIISHDTSKIIGGLEKMYDRLNIICSKVGISNIKTLVVGPDYPKEARRFWLDKGCKVFAPSKRFNSGLSGTELRQRGISIITNFGCKYKCKFCIWKNHPLNKTIAPTDWNKLELFLKENAYKQKVSISGGGDPLYNIENSSKTVNWWKKLISITKKNDLKVAVHTREKIYNTEFWTNLHRCSLSSDNLSKEQEYIEYLSNIVNVRLVRVIDHSITEKIVQNYIEFCIKHNIQLTFKQLVAKQNQDKKYFRLKKQYGHENLGLIKFLDSGDYNLYYMPDNTIRSVYKW